MLILILFHYSFLRGCSRTYSIQFVLSETTSEFVLNFSEIWRCYSLQLYFFFFVVLLFLNIISKYVKTWQYIVKIALCKFWKVSISLSTRSLIFYSSVQSTMNPTSHSVYLTSQMLSSLEFWLWSFMYLFCILRNCLNIWDTFIKTVLMSLSANSNICVKPSVFLAAGCQGCPLFPDSTSHTLHSTTHEYICLFIKEDARIISFIFQANKCLN